MSSPKLSRDEMKNAIEEALRHPASEADKNQTLEELYQKFSIYQQELEYQNDELRRTAEELTKSQERWKKLFEVAPTAYGILTIDGYLLSGNQRFRSLSGGVDRLQKMLAPESQDIFFLRWRELTTKGACEATTLQIFTSKGKGFYRFEGTLWPGESEQVLVTLTDITGEVMVREELAQTKKLESIGFLAGGIAHDFNNLLEVIFARLEVAKERAKREPALSSDLAHISQAAEIASQLTKQLLGYARKQIALPRRLELQTEINKLSPTLQSLSTPAKLLILPSPEVAILADQEHLSQILTNLCTNARDASGLNGTIILGWVVKGQEVEITLSDNGTGMDAETAAKAFEPFFTTKPHLHGTGLGLATVEGLVRQNKGRVSLLTRPGQGTSVIIHFPLFDLAPSEQAGST